DREESTVGIGGGSSASGSSQTNTTEDTGRGGQAEELGTASSGLGTTDTTSVTESTGVDTSTTTAETGVKADSEPGIADDYGWLPRLKLPPALAPLSEESVSASSSQGSEQESGEARSVQSATTEHTEQ